MSGRRPSRARSVSWPTGSREQDAARSPVDHVSDEGLGRTHMGGGVELDFVEFLVEVGGHEGGAYGDTGLQDGDSQGPLGVDDGGPHLVHAFSGSQVRLHRSDMGVGGQGNRHGLGMNHHRRSVFDQCLRRDSVGDHGRGQL